ncbi:MAG: HAD family hydrolase [Clostridiaceae bacterium]|jgi:phosphoglycolate phosphatase|nr:HAD family hydrolase [Clostridiaceae bacterium]
MVFRHIVWDWNGTLLDDANVCAKAIDDMFKKRNLGEVTLGDYREKIVFPVINLYQVSGFDLEKEDYQVICDEYIENYLKHSAKITLQKDSAFVLEEFRKKGLIQHIVSASSSDILKEQVSYYGVEPYFDHILGQADNRADSKVNLAWQLIGLTGCRPEEMLFIGDTVHDHEVANEVGFHCALVSNGHCSEERLAATGAPVFASLSELYEHMKCKIGE